MGSQCTEQQQRKLLKEGMKVRYDEFFQAVTHPATRKAMRVDKAERIIREASRSKATEAQAEEVEERKERLGKTTERRRRRKKKRKEGGAAFLSRELERFDSRGSGTVSRREFRVVIEKAGVSGTFFFYLFLRPPPLHLSAYLSLYLYLYLHLFSPATRLSHAPSQSERPHLLSQPPRTRRRSRPTTFGPSATGTAAVAEATRTWTGRARAESAASPWSTASS